MGGGGLRLLPEGLVALHTCASLREVVAVGREKGCI